MAGLNLSSRYAHYILISHFAHIGQAIIGRGVRGRFYADRAGVEPPSIYFGVDCPRATATAPSQGISGRKASEQACLDLHAAGRLQPLEQAWLAERSGFLL
jgi:hypothetical protein